MHGDFILCGIYIAKGLNIMFSKAVKNAAKLRMSIAGPSGSGKTWTALTFAAALSPSERIAVVDTEHGSASKYASDFTFDVVEMTNFHPSNYVKAIKAAVDDGYEVIVLDSISHAWNGPGGILSIVNQNFGKWKDVAPIEQAFIEAIVSSPIHIIATMRAKVQYEVEKDERGKPMPKKVGMGAIQRDGMEYEFDIAAMMDVQNSITIEKTRCPAINGLTVNRPDASFLKPVIQWLGGSTAAPVRQPVAQTVQTPPPANGKAPETPSAPATQPAATEQPNTAGRFHAEGTQTFSPAKWDGVRGEICKRLGVTSSNDIPTDIIAQLADSFKANRRAWQNWERNRDMDMPLAVPVVTA